jgi:tyrosyl-tRNA synthetase
LIQTGAVNLNGKKVEDLNAILEPSEAIEGKYSVLRKGKKKYAIITHR